MVVAQLVEQSLINPEVPGSNPVIVKIYIEHLVTVNCIEKTKRKKRTGMAHFFLKKCLSLCCTVLWCLVKLRLISIVHFLIDSNYWWPTISPLVTTLSNGDLSIIDVGFWTPITTNYCTKLMTLVWCKSINQNMSIIFRVKLVVQIKVEQIKF